MTTITTPITCPSWCITDMALHMKDDPGCALHQGEPINGRFTPWLSDRTHELTVTIETRIDHQDDLNATDLRQLAQDALGAADWLERHSFRVFQVEPGSLSASWAVAETPAGPNLLLSPDLAAIKANDLPSIADRLNVSLSVLGAAIEEELKRQL